MMALSENNSQVSRIKYILSLKDQLPALCLCRLKEEVRRVCTVEMSGPSGIVDIVGVDKDAI